jgi:hypothetical protein
MTTMYDVGGVGYDPSLSGFDDASYSK